MLKMSRVLLAVGLAGFLVLLGLQTPAHAKTAESDTGLAVANTVMSDVHELGVVAELAAVAHVTVTVRPGDTLSGLAAMHCGSWSGWTNIYNENRDVVGGNPDLIFPGQRLTISCATGAVAARVEQSAPALQSSGWTNPTPGACVTSGFGPRWGTVHQGVDLGAGSGTPIHAAAAGTVTRAGWIWSGYGISVTIDHGGVSTHYAHQSGVNVGVGQWVNAGDTVGWVGSTGFSTGPHLHYEVATSSNVLGSQIEPVSFMQARGVYLGC